MLTNRFERALQLGRCVASGIEIQYSPYSNGKLRFSTKPHGLSELQVIS